MLARREFLAERLPEHQGGLLAVIHPHDDLTLTDIIVVRAANGDSRAHELIVARAIERQPGGTSSASLRQPSSAAPSGAGPLTASCCALIRRRMTHDSVSCRELAHVRNTR